MSRRIRIIGLSLGYAGGLVLHTASSGSVPRLDELRLIVEEDGALAAIGATRLNIAYLSGIPAAELKAAILAVASKLDWSGPPADWPDQIDERFPGLPAPVRMLFEMAAADGRARAEGRTLAASLGGGVAPAPLTSDTNQTLFWQDDDSLVARARAYAERGFLQLKLRIGIADFADDLRRLALLRSEIGPAARLSVDANGTWDEASAPGRLEGLARLGVEYVEQPLAASDWAGTVRLARATPVPIMLDEALSSYEAIERLAETGAAQLAHLKLAKLGGLDRMMSAARLLQAAGVGIMIGQMNEGAPSTLAAAHAAIALAAPLRELYGADQLADEPAEPALVYADGVLRLPAGPGLGLASHPHPPDCDLHWDHTS
ncbi:mandelate racemase/muconate lactonizing enzyme family protein [Phreatobacter cathodiphilus]|uniref:Mandelate racemase n=1 Tax=Phreatobacter cathodiphilus TaxID=1868589 RepID=A0A2S0N8B2_9HYPH|nr:mandelate racemase/muconate lactonizing enzyme family protein [Phreatobacter cathodiphilus]AVO44388.1 mandelate racemase [Phreatobacter cathodiphilus]